MKTAATDTIFLRGLAVECVIGFIEWERRIKQRVVIDFELPADCRRAAATDAPGGWQKVKAGLIAHFGVSRQIPPRSAAKGCSSGECWPGRRVISPWLCNGSRRRCPCSALQTTWRRTH